MQINNPFRYRPSPLMLECSKKLISEIEKNPELESILSKGKMLGILRCKNGEILCAYSGKRISLEYNITIDGQRILFSEPIYDITQGYFKEKEAEISALNKQAEELKLELNDYHKEIKVLNIEIDRYIEQADRLSKKLKRKELINNLVEKSKKELEIVKIKRANESIKLQDWTFSQYIFLNALGKAKNVHEIFANNNSAHIPPSGVGDCAAPKLLQEAFQKGLEPIEIGEFWYGKSPEGSVRSHGRFYPSCSWKCGRLLPFMLKGFDIIDTSVTDKILNTYKKNVDVTDKVRNTYKTTIERKDTTSHNPVNENCTDLEIIYDDEDIIVVNKSSGVPSVPGLDGRNSLLEILKERIGDVYEIHRLDLDTSGLIVYAKNKKAQSLIRKQFEAHTVQKTYLAILDDSYPSKWLTESSTSKITEPIPNKLTDSTLNKITESTPNELTDSILNKITEPILNELTDSNINQGVIELPLAPDYEDKPRQKVDFAQGKAAITHYRFLTGQEYLNALNLFVKIGCFYNAAHRGINEDIDSIKNDSSYNNDAFKIVEFTPQTGRTHQLRVHAAHFKGLGSPIKGDLLYGSGESAEKLCLIAYSISFIHPTSNQKLYFKL